MLSVVGILNEISLNRLITALCVGSTKLALLFHDPSDVLITSWLCHTLHDFYGCCAFHCSHIFPRLTFLTFFPARLQCPGKFSCSFVFYSSVSFYCSRNVVKAINKDKDMTHFSLISCQTTVKSTLGFPALFTLCHVHVFREHYAICRIRDYFGR